MSRLSKTQTIDRRELIVGAGAAIAVATLVGDASIAIAQDKPPTYDEIVSKILGQAKAEEGKVNIDLPEIAENGNTVPYSVTVDSPMSDADHVKAIHVLSTGNPSPTIASYHFSPASGKATVSSRMRLAKTQDIVSIAELSNGKFLMGKRTVKVTIGGCGG